MNSDYKAQSERTDEAERLLISPFKRRPHDQPQEWTPENISELTGQTSKGIVTYSSLEDFVKKVCDAHNAALKTCEALAAKQVAAERKTTQEVRKFWKDTYDTCHSTLLAERAKVKS